VKDLTRIFTAKVCNRKMLLMMKSKNVRSKIFASTNNFIKAYITFIREFNMLTNSTMIANILVLVIAGVFCTEFVVLFQSLCGVSL